MIDIDHFKRFNDRHGHYSGNDVLAAVAATIAEQCRRGVDLVSRWGGEEFVVLMPETDMTAARAAAERIRQEVQTRQIPTTNRSTGDLILLGSPEHPDDQCTISIGSSMRTESCFTLFARLDRRGLRQPVSRTPMVEHRRPVPPPIAGAPDWGSSTVGESSR